MAIEAEKHILRERLEFHIEDVDVQHRRLAKLIVEVRLSASRNSGALLRALANLTAYLEIHVSDEEEFMKKHGYPEPLLNSHCAEHREILERVRTIADSAGTELMPDCHSIANWIQEWLEEHAAAGDRAYIDYFRNKFPG